MELLAIFLALVLVIGTVIVASYISGYYFATGARAALRNDPIEMVWDHKNQSTVIK